uniref:Phospholipase n=1 Tax=Albugo laibachii Nc14 TaxID=890382 RepID=F0WM41_9STRA|nr:phospholipase D putative [Albugo laibachii Nc14]|eukprot:CCA22369.1 phospholipase D putative [Albugo laibachii Nc14]
MPFNDKYEMQVFEEAPTIKVVNARIIKTWAHSHVQYTLLIKYRNYEWQIQISKAAIYSLWFYTKRKPHLIRSVSTLNNHANDSGSDGEELERRFPQLRKLLFSKSSTWVDSASTKFIEVYLNTVVQVPTFLHSPEVNKFLQVSKTTFHELDGKTSIKEGWLRVRLILRHNFFSKHHTLTNVDNSLLSCLCVLKPLHNLTAKKWCWVALRQSSIVVYLSPEDECALGTFLFDPHFRSGNNYKSVDEDNEILIFNSSYRLELEAKSNRVISDWAAKIRDVATQSPWTQFHRDDSFAITRYPRNGDSYAKWYVDGENTYAAIYKGLCSATEEIFIHGWWICPSIHLLRPAVKFPHSRLDLVLKKKAEEGVKVYILMYKEVALALPLNSLYSKAVFGCLHPNVYVLRDPDFSMKEFGLWSHHEKIVCIDQNVAFLGGLDLCFGRWDTPEHRLFDEDTELTNFDGKDYSNPRIKDFVQVEQPDVDLMDRSLYPRMPWHDCHCRLEGHPARDVARHFILRWNFAVTTRHKTDKLSHLVPRKDLDSARHQNSAYCSMKEPSFLALRKNRSDASLLKPRYDQELKDECEDTQVTKRTYSDRVNKSARDRLINHDEFTLQRGQPCVCQIVRSLSFWSGGCSTEKSIQNAYIRLISSARHFIYIENQFFVSGIEGDPSCSNRIAGALVERIRYAAANHEKFRVMILMPLLPAFPGQPQDKEAYSLRGVMHWQYRSISRGKNSIYHILSQVLDDPFEYITFYGLRKYDRQHNRLHTEQIYIHNKIMIVDDRQCIIGSANINERSMRGDRDSEIAVTIEDTEFDESIKIADNTISVGKFCHSFRMKLFEEHFGLVAGSRLYEEYMDPVRKETWFTIQKHAHINSGIYESVFGCIPAEGISRFDQIKPANQAGIELHQKGADKVHQSAETDDVNSDKLTSRVFEITASNSKAPSGNQQGLPMIPLVSASRSDIGHSQSPRNGPVDIDEVRSIDNTAVLDHLEKLAKIQGNIVQFPLRFLAEEELEPGLYPAELFQ